jgi:hypothetical protein
MARPLQRQIGHNSSRVTKGKRMFVEFGDPRSAWARRWNDLVLTHAADVGGFDMLSEAQISLCRRAATMEIELETMEARRSEGQQIDLELYSRLLSLLCRALDLVGIRRLTKPLDPMAELVKSMAAYPATVDDDEEHGEA